METAILGGVGLLTSRSASRSQERASQQATDAQVQAQREAIEAQRQATQEAREFAIPLFEAQQANRLLGMQAGLDLFGQTIPQQMQAFQGGNLAAQQTLSAGLNPQIQAILGGQIDLSGLQPQQVSLPDPNMFNVQLPEFTTIGQALAGDEQQAFNPNGLTGDAARRAFFAGGGRGMGGGTANFGNASPLFGNTGFGLDNQFMINRFGRS